MGPQFRTFVLLVIAVIVVLRNFIQGLRTL
jgi:hypothetical protein